MLTFGVDGPDPARAARSAFERVDLDGVALYGDGAPACGAVLAVVVSEDSGAGFGLPLVSSDSSAARVA